MAAISGSSDKGGKRLVKSVLGEEAADQAKLLQNIADRASQKLMGEESFSIPPRNAIELPVTFSKVFSTTPHVYCELESGDPCEYQRFIRTRNERGFEVQVHNLSSSKTFAARLLWHAFVFP